MGLSVYATLYTTEGKPVLVAAVDVLDQKDILRRGFPLTVLDPDISGAEYSLLYGSTQDLSDAKMQTDVLLIEGSMAVARMNADQTGSLIALGLDVAPLVPQPLIAPEGQPYLPALPDSVTYSQIVQDMVDELDSQSLYDHVGGLSGEWPVIVNASPFTFFTRYTFAATSITKVTRYTHDFFASLGLTTWYDYFSGGELRNVIAQQEGLIHPEKIVLLTAHLDSTSLVDNPDPGTFAPGADDNASGSAALMRIAEILTQSDFGCTLRYALFTAEEQGLFGSSAYAADLYSLGEDLQGVLNLDMLGYHTRSSPVFELHARPDNAGDLAIANLFADVIPAYSIQLNPRILQDGKAFSDHASFWKYGYPAVMAIEDWTNHTPYYHTTGDQLETLNFTYYTNFARAALAAFAHMGCLMEGQLSGFVRDEMTSAPIAGAGVEAWQNDQKIRSVVTQADGSYHLALQPGTYTVRFSAVDHLSESVFDVSITNTLNTPLDAVLTPCIFVRDAEISASNWNPSIDETVLFSGTVSGRRQSDQFFLGFWER